MSWSIAFIGKPEKVVEALEKHSETLSGASKEEYDAALPNIVGLVKMNKGLYNPVLSVSGSGHAYGTADGNGYSQCYVKVEQVPGILAE